VLLIGLILNAFFGLKKTPYTMSVQPLGALMFLIYAVIWIFDGSLWPGTAALQNQGGPLEL